MAISLDPRKKTRVAYYAFGKYALTDPILGYASMTHEGLKTQSAHLPKAPNASCPD
jgi:hypothetical protein